MDKVTRHPWIDCEEAGGLALVAHQLILNRPGRDAAGCLAILVCSLCEFYRADPIEVMKEAQAAWAKRSEEVGLGKGWRDE